MTFSMANCTPSAEDVVIFLLFPAMRTPVTLLIVSLFGILFVTGCGGSVRTPVLNAQGKQVGEIDIQGQSVATIYLKGDDIAGKVRGNVVRNATGGKVGTIEQKDGLTLLTDAKGQDVGSIENGTDCYGKSPEKLGSVSIEDDVTIAGAACLLLLLPR